MIAADPSPLTHRRRKPWARDRYPLDWEQLSLTIRSRAGWKCQQCGRHHRAWVLCLPTGEWKDKSGIWHSRTGRVIPPPALEALHLARYSYTVVAAAHLDHEPLSSKLASLCRRCHMLYDQHLHRYRAWLTFRARYAVGDLWLGRYDQLYVEPKPAISFAPKIIASIAHEQAGAHG